MMNQYSIYLSEVVDWAGFQEIWRVCCPWNS